MVRALPPHLCPSTWVAFAQLVSYSIGKFLRGPLVTHLFINVACGGTICKDSCIKKLKECASYLRQYNWFLTSWKPCIQLTGPTLSWGIVWLCALLTFAGGGIVLLPHCKLVLFGLMNTGCSVFHEEFCKEFQKLSGHPYKNVWFGSCCFPDLLPAFCYVCAYVLPPLRTYGLLKASKCLWLLHIPMFC